MRGLIGTFARRHCVPLGCVLMGFCGCTAPLADAQPRGGSSVVSAITQITLERDCFGCATGTVIGFRRDGSATLTVTGKARHGTQDSTSRGVISEADFDALARLAVSNGFFDLNETYEDAQTQDGAWTTTSVVRGGQDKRVFSRGDAGPSALRVLETAIEALKARTTFVRTSRAPTETGPSGNFQVANCESRGVTDVGILYSRTNAGGPSTS
jgi:hypothetical protein